MYSRSNVVTYLIKRGREYLRRRREPIEFTGNEEVDAVLNDLERLPHLFMLGVQMDRGIDRVQAWGIPYRINRLLNLKNLEFETFRQPSIEDLVKIFIGNNLHRYPAKMARIFHNTLEHIAQHYEGDARLIWREHPSSATVIRRFLQFDGMTIRMAARVANSLYRDFKVRVTDTSSLDLSPDQYTRRIFQRTGFINRTSSDEELIYCARELHLGYPGIFDKPCEEIARTVCTVEKPDCRHCPLNDSCMKYI
jgi:endonuclease III